MTHRTQLYIICISFGRLADLSGSMTLLNAHESIDDLDHGPTESSDSSAKAEFMKVRAALIRSVVMSFVPPQGLTPVRMVKLPTAEKLHSHYQATGVYGAARPWLPKVYAAAFDPYASFYVARQRDLALKVRRLRALQRKLLTRSLKNTLSLPHSTKHWTMPFPCGRKSFFLSSRSFSPAGSESSRLRLLEPYQSATSRDLEPWLSPGGWIVEFCSECELLLAN